MAEGLIVVPLYARQAPAELVSHDEGLLPGADLLRRRRACAMPSSKAGRRRLRNVLFDEIFSSDPSGASNDKPLARGIRSGHHHLHLGNIGRSQGRGADRGQHRAHAGLHLGPSRSSDGSDMPGQDRVFHYLPFCFAGSWIMLLTCLLRRSLLTLNTDLNKLSGEMRDGRARLFPQCSGTARTHAQGGRRAAVEDRRLRR